MSTNNKMGKLIGVQGDLLDIGTECIVQQCNCVTTRAHGLSDAIARAFRYADVYGQREPVLGVRGMARNRSGPQTRPQMGQVVICKPPEGERGPAVACMFGQIAPGKPGAWAAKYQVSSAEDSASARLEAFRLCLLQLQHNIIQHGWRSVSLPDGIGCGLAGGNGVAYLAAIRSFAMQLPESVSVFLVYKPPGKRVFDMQYF